MYYFNTRLVLIFTLLLSTVGAFCQDIIYHNNGNKIYCRIVGEDSVSIFFLRPPQKRKFEIKKSEVLRYDQQSRSKKTTDTTSSKEFSEVFILNFSGGAATPLGDFASQDVNSEASGLAKKGFLFHFSGIVKLSDYLGFSMTYKYQRHRFSHELIAQANSAYYNATFSSSASDWLIKGFFGGLHLCTPVKKIEHLTIDMDLSAGFPKYALPSLVLSVNAPNIRGTVTQYSSTARAATFLGGIGLKYRASKNFAFSANVSYLRARAEFYHVYIKSSNGQADYFDYKQNVRSLNVMVGVSFLLFEHKTR